jgi:hypothetical protein
MQGACVGSDKTDTDPNNAAKRTSIQVSCNAVFSNKQGRSLKFKAARDINSGSVWTLPGFLNASVNLGSLGAIATNPVTDVPRRYTLQITSDNTYTMSGIGNPGASPMP